MSKTFSVSLLLVLIVSQISCKTLELEGKVVSPENLELSIPAQSLDLRFAQGYKQIKQQHYYYESSRWISKARNMDFLGTYTYLLGDYIFVREPGPEELIDKYFEDRVVSVGDRELVAKKTENAGQKDEVTVVVPFTLENAQCHFFQRFLIVGSAHAYDYIVGEGPIGVDQGDAKIDGYLCNYGKTAISNSSLEEFILNIQGGLVPIGRHIEELKSRDEKSKSTDSDATT